MQKLEFRVEQCKSAQMFEFLMNIFETNSERPRAARVFAKFYMQTYYILILGAASIQPSRSSDKFAAFFGLVLAVIWNRYRPRCENDCLDSRYPNGTSYPRCLSSARPVLSPSSDKAFVCVRRTRLQTAIYPEPLISMAWVLVAPLEEGFRAVGCAYEFELSGEYANIEVDCMREADSLGANYFGLVPEKFCDTCPLIVRCKIMRCPPWNAASFALS